MVYIKKLVIYGFKSFPRKTEIPLSPGINVIVGANGSGKSNISDALCFVLGRLNIKSMRAAKAGNLIFLGSKAASPSKEASVEIILDNSDHVFSLDKEEISIERIVRRNGQSIYRINKETKSRQEVLTVLAEAGIDPNGFNIVLQGEIQNFVRMQTEERRQVIEEVAGISIYEMRKEKSLQELNKTDEKLKEINSVLRERSIYLNNLEKERQQALKFKKLEEESKNLKASILTFDLNEKKKELQEIKNKIESLNKNSENEKKNLQNIKSSIETLESKISLINLSIQKATGTEQELLNQEIINIRTSLAGLNVKKENYEKKISSLKKEKIEFENLIASLEKEINDIQKGKSSNLPDKKEIDSKKKELELIENKRKKFYSIKSELKILKERLQDKKNNLSYYSNESEFLVKEIKSLSEGITDLKINPDKIETLKISLNEKKALLETLLKRELELEKNSSAMENEIENQEKTIEKISKMDICPLCKSKITPEHIKNIHVESYEKINTLKTAIEKSDKEISEIYNKKRILNQEIEELIFNISKANSDLIKLSSINEKQLKIKDFQEKIENLKKEIYELEKRDNSLEKEIEEYSNIEEKYESIRFEIQNLSLKNNENLDSEVSFKIRELERINSSLKNNINEQEEINQEFNESVEKITSLEKELEKKKKQEQEIIEKFNKLVFEKENYQKQIREKEMEISQKQNKIYEIEQLINNQKIEEAKVNAEISNLEIELLNFQNVEIIKGSKENLNQRLLKCNQELSSLGSINLRALEVYDLVKQEYDSIKEKAEKILKEKENILKIIEEIDIKKKRTFLQTFNSINDFFSKNFSQLSQKGQVFLELEDKKDPFSKGVNIILKAGHGKIFDIKSLSGGEQTLIALSLIFAIQEYKPYYFYIFDEIDAALDKRNSERLAELLKRYMQKGQYIVITHNDEVISNATNLYGVSMTEGISKIISLRISD
jgi:chromosome segregation protein